MRVRPRDVSNGYERLNGVIADKVSSCWNGVKFREEKIEGISTTRSADGTESTRAFATETVTSLTR